MYLLEGLKMKQGVLKIDDLDPDGVRIVVDWIQFDSGASVFIPCINTEQAKKQVEVIAKRKNWVIKTQIRVETDCLGLRIWRVT
jgi:hypothetical protein